MNITGKLSTIQEVHLALSEPATQYEVCQHDLRTIPLLNENSVISNSGVLHFTFF